MGSQIDNACFFTGHRPDKLGGYDRFAQFRAPIIGETMPLISRLVFEYKVDTFYVGGANGFDRLAAIAVMKFKERIPNIRLVVCAPFENQHIKWRYSDRCEYLNELARADEVIYIDTVDGYNVDKYTEVGEYSPIKYVMRDRFMVDNARHGIALYNGTRGGTNITVTYAQKLKRNLMIINPGDIIAI